MIQRIALRRTLAHGDVSIADVIRRDTDFQVQAYNVFISVRFFSLIHINALQSELPLISAATF